MIGELPAFPWSTLLPYKKQALAHPDGIINLALGEPVDPTPEVVQDALKTAGNAPGYPLTEGSLCLRQTAAGWLARRLGVTVDESAVLPALGTKELIAWLPTMLARDADPLVVIPELAFPTYDVSACLAGTTPVNVSSWVGDPNSDSLEQSRIIWWLNSPSNPEGRVLSVAELRDIVARARACGAVVANDECYIEHGWEEHPVSILHPEVCGDSHANVLAIHSLSKRSNMAGYRAGFVAGDPALITRLLEVRRQAGHALPAPIQAAMIAAYADDTHVDQQRGMYLRRRAALRAALISAGFKIDHSTASLFLWATRDESCWATVEYLAAKGILVAPGSMYGDAGKNHVRIAITASDEHIEAAAQRLAG